MRICVKQINKAFLMMVLSGSIVIILMGILFLVYRLLNDQLSFLSFRFQANPNTPNQSSIVTILDEEAQCAASEKLPEEELAIWLPRLEAYMQLQKPFLQARLKLPELAAQLDIRPHLLSRLINQHYQKNFYQFINQYRVEHATYLLTHPEYQQYTLEAIGGEAGFSSKSTFHARFRDIIGMSPGGYRKKQKNK